MDQEIIFLVEESSEGGWIARALGYSIHTEADTLQELKDKVKEATICHFEESQRPHILRLHMVKDEVMAV